MITESQEYTELSELLQQEELTLTISELHGLLSGMICGGMPSKDWEDILYQVVNNNELFSPLLLDGIKNMRTKIINQLADQTGFEFNLVLADVEPATDLEYEAYIDYNSSYIDAEDNSSENIFMQADSLSEWVSHFLLGLGLAQPQIDKETGEIKELLTDLSQICNLGYDTDEDQEELSHALEEIIEYVRTAAMFLYSYFMHEKEQKNKPQIH